MCLQESHKTDDPLAPLKIVPFIQKNCRKDLLHSLQVFFNNYREHKPWERAQHMHTHTSTHKQTEMVKLDFWRKQAGAKRKLGMAALPLPTWWTVSLDGRMSGVLELEFSTWWFPSANSGSRWVSCEAEFPIPRCTKWLVSSLPLWLSIPPFDIAILQQQRHKFKSFGCFRTRSTPSFMSLWPQRKELFPYCSWIT